MDKPFQRFRFTLAACVVAALALQPVGTIADSLRNSLTISTSIDMNDVALMHEGQSLELSLEARTQSYQAVINFSHRLYELDNVPSNCSDCRIVAYMTAPTRVAFSPIGWLFSDSKADYPFTLKRFNDAFYDWKQHVISLVRRHQWDDARAEYGVVYSAFNDAIDDSRMPLGPLDSISSDHLKFWQKFVREVCETVARERSAMNRSQYQDTMLAFETTCHRDSISRSMRNYELKLSNDFPTVLHNWADYSRQAYSVGQQSWPRRALDTASDAHPVFYSEEAKGFLYDDLALIAGVTASPAFKQMLVELSISSEDPVWKQFARLGDGNGTFDEVDMGAMVLAIDALYKQQK